MKPKANAYFQVFVQIADLSRKIYFDDLLSPLLGLTDLLEEILGLKQIGVFYLRRLKAHCLSVVAEPIKVQWEMKNENGGDTTPFCAICRKGHFFFYLWINSFETSWKVSGVTRTSWPTSSIWLSVLFGEECQVETSPHFCWCDWFVHSCLRWLDTLPCVEGAKSVWVPFVVICESFVCSEQQSIPG